MRTLEKLTIKNFKSIREQTLALGRLNVFIGGNGAGKSNLIEVFSFLREIVNQTPIPRSRPTRTRSMHGGSFAIRCATIRITNTTRKRPGSCSAWPRKCRSKL